MVYIVLQVDIGCSFFCQAEVPDASRVFVCLGMGIFTELTHPEAIEFIDKKQELLKTRIDHMSMYDCFFCNLYINSQRIFVVDRFNRKFVLLIICPRFQANNALK